MRTSKPEFAYYTADEMQDVTRMIVRMADSGGWHTTESLADILGEWTEVGAAQALRLCRDWGFVIHDCHSGKWRANLSADVEA
jgi:hypothetical protein